MSPHPHALIGFNVIYSETCRMYLQVLYRVHYGINVISMRSSFTLLYASVAITFCISSTGVEVPRMRLFARWKTQQSNLCGKFARDTPRNWTVAARHRRWPPLLPPPPLPLRSLWELDSQVTALALPTNSTVGRRSISTRRPPCRAASAVSTGVRGLMSASCRSRSMKLRCQSPHPCSTVCLRVAAASRHPAS